MTDQPFIRDRITESPYTTVGGDSLPSIAERCGHPGEWLALAEFNEGHIHNDWQNLQPGLLIDIPGEWIYTPEIEPPTTTRTKTGSSSSLKDAEKAAEEFERRHSKD